MSLALALCLLQGPALALPGDGQAWVLEHDGIQARYEGEHVVEVVRRPRLRRGEVELEATMAIFWLDRAALQDRRIMLDTAPAPTLADELPQDLLDTLNDDPASRVLHEVYFEGPVVYRLAGRKVGSAEAFYLDIESETGWIADAEFLLDRELDGREVNWRARADWLQRKPDATLHSSQAVVTSCSFVDRHLYVQTEDMTVARLDPAALEEELTPGEPVEPGTAPAPDASAEEEDDLGAFEVTLKGNSLRAYDLVSLPLPPLSWRADQQGRPILPEIKIGSSARFGSFVETALSFDGSWLGNRVHDVLGADTDDPETRRNLHSDGRLGVSLLGSRGVLLDVGFLLENPGRYTWDMALGGLVDSDRDRGLLRVDEDDREVPDGTPGELCMRGPTLFSGYWAAEAANAEAFRSADQELIRTYGFADVNSFFEGSLFFDAVKPELEARMLKEFERIKAGF